MSPVYIDFLAVSAFDVTISFFTLDNLTLYVLNFKREHKHIFKFYVIPPHWYDTGT